MKKLLVSIFTIALLFSCSNETVQENENQENLAYFLSNDLSQQLPLAKFDQQSKGLYHGIIASEDSQFHGEIWVNIANDGYYKAMVKTVEGEKLFFNLDNSISSKHEYAFIGERGSFRVSIINPENATVTRTLIDGEQAHIQLLKERNSTKNRAVIGTFVDSADSGFTGTWDLLSTSTQVITIPTGLGFPFPPTVDVTVNIISEVVITKSGGGVVTDDTMELFTPGPTCDDTFPTGEQQPFFSGEQNIGGAIDINEYGVANQISTFFGSDCNWNFIFSKAAGDLYYDIDCNEVTSGTWSWRTRSGTITLNM